METIATGSRVEHPISAGGVVYRVVGDRLEVAVCGRHSPEGWTWGLPKGMPNPGESLEETAVREVSEETGLKVVLEAPIDRIRYWFVRPTDGVRCHKMVYFYLMRPVGGSVSDHDEEFDTVRWSHQEEALRTLTYKNEVNILKRALRMVLQKGKEGTKVD